MAASQALSVTFVSIYDQEFLTLSGKRASCASALIVYLSQPGANGREQKCGPSVGPQGLA